MIDEVFKSDIHYQAHTDVVTHKVTQPSESIILERNKQLRNAPGAIKDLGAESSTWGRQLASIPFIMYEKALRDGFRFNSPDKDTANKEMQRFLATPEGKACMV